jgi:transcriptional regulator with XRE-family HTH domain
MAHRDRWKQWGPRLREHLKKNGSSLAKLAEKMIDENGDALAESTLRSWTNGNRKVNLADFFELCKKADADPALILFDQPLMSENLKHGLLAVTALMDPTTPPRHSHRREK